MKNVFTFPVCLVATMLCAVPGCYDEPGGVGVGDGSAGDRAASDDTGEAVDVGGHPDTGEAPDGGSVDFDGSGVDADVADGGPTDGPSHFAGTYKVGALDFDVVRKSIRETTVIADGSNGGYVVAFADASGQLGFRIHALTLRSAGAGAPPVPGPEVELDDIGAVEHWGQTPDVADGRDAQGGLMLAVWYDCRSPGCPNGDLEIYGQRMRARPDGTIELLGGNINISDAPGENEDWPCVGFDGKNGTFFVAYSSTREAALRVDGKVLLGRTVAVDGTVGPEVRLGEDEHWQVNCAVSGGDGRFLVAWSDYMHATEPDGELNTGYRVRLVEQGVPGPVLPAQRLGDIIPSRPGVAYNRRAGEWMVSYAINGASIHSVIFKPDGTRRGQEVLAAAPADGCGVPFLAYSFATNSYLLAYHSWATTDAYAQELDPDGAPIGDRTSVNAGAPVLGTFYTPVAGSTDTAEFLVVMVKNWNWLAGTIFASDHTLP